ncbi:MAG: PepSY-associated TM helix domain-containing protein [Nitrosomonas sp.]|nr:PepSY domain-containing protein [Burkholderiales bacterium]MDF0678753.1 PepSY-associated TM helix domain-containing protein [Nitrosomonas sp.]
MRSLLVYIHRYTGLLLVPFLIIVGLTGSVLAFNQELDRWLNPVLLTVPTPKKSDMQRLDPFTLGEHIERQESRARIDWINLNYEAGQTYRFFLVPRINPKTNQLFELPYNEVYLNPYTGERTGTRTWGEVSLAEENIMPFLYRLHYTLALPKHIVMFGTYALGVAALLWFFDCFVGFYLTLPPGRKRSGQPDPRTQHSYPFWQRWKAAWQIKPSRFNYDLHRASGLWLWPLLLILAWSGIAFNLKEVYQPVMSTVLNMRGQEDLPVRDTPVETPQLDWREAYRHGQHYIYQAGMQYGFNVEREQVLSLDRMHGVYRYRVKTNQDWGKYGATVVTLDADTGALISLTLPETDSIGDIVHRWITWLHTARVFGLPMQLLICMTGLIVATLSITGVVIWQRKRKAHKP